MNRVLIVILGAAIVALVAFGAIVFTGAPPVPWQPDRTERATAAPVEKAAPPDRHDASADATTIAATAEQTAAATRRFDAWAKPLRDAGLEVTADRVTEAGETVSVAGLALREASETLGWRWTTERASLYDRELFHLQAAGATTFAIATGAGQQTTWSGRADAIGVAVQRDLRYALGRSLVVRINGLSLAAEGAPVPLTLGDGQLRIVLKGGSGLLAPGTQLALRLNDLTLPWAAGSALGSRLSSFSTAFAIDRPITRYSLQQVLDFFTRGNAADVTLGTVAADWGTLHFTGKGNFGLSPAGQPRARFEVKVSDVLMLLDAIGAAGGASGDALAGEYAALLLELGRNSDEPAVPMAISLQDGAIVLELPGGEIRLDAVPQAASGA